MTNSTPKYTSLRGQNYNLHYKLPASIYNNTNLKSQLIRHTLYTQDPTMAGSLAQLIVCKLQEYSTMNNPEAITKDSIENVIRSVLTGFGQVSDNTPIPLIPPARLVATEQGPKVSEVFDQYCNEMIRAEVWHVKSRDDVIGAFRVFTDIVGDVPLSALKADLCRHYKAKLMQYPVQRFKLHKLKNLSFEAIAREL